MTDDPLAHLDFTPEDETLDDPQPVAVHRAALFDVAVNAKEIAEAVGLPPISDEMEVAERMASIRRLLVVNQMAPAVEDHTAFLAGVFIRIQKESAIREGRQIPDESWAVAYDSLRHMLNSSGMSLVGALVDLGALQVTEPWQQPSEQESDS